MFYDKNGKIIEVYPYGSDEQRRYEKFLEIIFEADRRCLEKLIEEKKLKEQEIDRQIEETNKKVFKECNQRSIKRYNLTQTARILKLHRQTLYYWIKKGWCKPRRDYRGYPVFTVLDIENLMKWRNTVKLE
ncbi:MAG: MerR family transcriptional regulator [Candidatus Omnitrophica bacterium]|nr:MerR family transcriptional regulator [Candidatus Omnitrophota bacterium]